LEINIKDIKLVNIAVIQFKDGCDKMMFEEMTYMELNKLYIKIGIELISRAWWVFPIAILIGFILFKRHRNWFK